MPPTLASVAALPQLGLRSLTGPLPDTDVGWVAVSELEDPTPFLEGGELLLTTGMRLTPASAAGYVSRLVGRGVAGLGFAVGVVHDTVPGELLAAARDQGLALLEVPRPTPFIAVGKAVSRMLAAEWYEDVTRAFRAQRELTRAALTGRGALVARLARLLGGWALLLDPSGGVLHAEPASAARRAGALTPELTRLRGSPRARGTEPPAARGTEPPAARGTDAPSASVALSLPGEHIAVQRIGLGERPRGFLAVGTDAPLPHVAHTIVGAAVALLTLQSETPRTGRDLRASLAALLLGRPEDGPAVPRGPVRVLACAGGAAVLDVLESDPAAGRGLALPLDGHVAVLVPDEASGAVESLLAGTGPVGVSDPASGDLTAALRQAGDALAAATRSGRDVVRHAELPGQGVLGLLDPRSARAFAAALLAPLREEDLVGTVRAYVAANGQGEAAARALGVHRHTLRSRMRRAADVLGRDPDDPAVRAELWIALAVMSNDDTRIRHRGDSHSSAP
ncbi:PucR family transcriptional regulator [Actinomadura sp. 6K520]|uniref:PucR family transcriptional regulator n=1 Tax=Actinomadura sp. 6K520 TaxID=2530364 RepID=UPI00105264CC|nr:PucR family transcriptional regulator [Actinomadura sp. 6K520]TDE34289.1 PucR family transcriptional regulator [Actinomadura sp. 6K520]